MTFGPRVVKGRTAKQRAATQAYARTIIAPTIPVTAPSSVTTRSWWVGLGTWEAFTAQARAERSRMQASPGGRRRVHADSEG